MMKRRFQEAEPGRASLAEQRSPPWHCRTWVPALLLLLSGSPVHAEESVQPALKTGHGIDLLQWSLAMTVVLAAIVLLAWLMRRLGSFSQLPTGRFRVLAALSVGPRERVVLLQAGDKQLVLGVAPGRVQTLCLLEGPDLIQAQEAAPATAPDFSRRLNELLTGRKP